MDSVAAGGNLDIFGPRESQVKSGGFTASTFILGVPPGIPLFLDSKSMSGRYQGRALQTGDLIEARATCLNLQCTSPSVEPRRVLHVPDMLHRAHFTGPAQRYKLPQRTGVAPSDTSGARLYSKFVSRAGGI